MNQTDTRRHPRREMVMKISYQDVDLLADYTENLSEEGIFITTTKKLAPGTEITFELSFPSLLKPIRLQGEVIWRRTPQSLEEIRPPGIGVRLKFQDDLERTWLQQLLGKLGVAGPAGERSTTPKTSYRVLLVEDNETIGSMFQEALKKHSLADRSGLTVMVCASGAEARAHLGQQRVDLLIIEWRLCQVGDNNLLAELPTRMNGNRPVVLVLGASDSEGQAAITAGADAFLRRPVPARGLLNTITSLLDRKPRDGIS